MFYYFAYLEWPLKYINKKNWTICRLYLISCSKIFNHSFWNALIPKRSLYKTVPVHKMAKKKLQPYSLIKQELPKLIIILKWKQLNRKSLVMRYKNVFLN